MFHRKLIIGLMIVMLFCVPSFAAQGCDVPSDDAAFIVDTPVLNMNTQTADLQENPTAGIVDSLTNDSLSVDSKGDVLIITQRGKQNSASPRSVRDLSTIGTYEEMFTISNTNNTIDPNRTSVAGNLVTIKTNDSNDSPALIVESQKSQTSLESINHAGIPNLIASRYNTSCIKGTAQNTDSRKSNN